MAREARCRQALRQRVSHHIMLAQWNQFNYTAQAQSSQLAKEVFPDIDVTHMPLNRLLVYEALSSYCLFKRM